MQPFYFLNILPLWKRIPNTDSELGLVTGCLFLYNNRRLPAAENAVCVTPSEKFIFNEKRGEDMTEKNKAGRPSYRILQIDPYLTPFEGDIALRMSCLLYTSRCV